MVEAGGPFLCLAAVVFSTFVQTVLNSLPATNPISGLQLRRLVASHPGSLTPPVAQLLRFAIASAARGCSGRRRGGPGARASGSGSPAASSRRGASSAVDL